MSIATRLNTDVPIAVCPAGVLAFGRMLWVLACSLKTTSELVDTLGGIARDNTLGYGRSSGRRGFDIVLRDYFCCSCTA